MDAAVRDHERISECPTAVSDRQFIHCSLATYQTCEAGQWFGLIRLPEIDRTNPDVRLATNRLIDAICEPRSDPPTSSQIRVLDVGPGQRLVLCRMKSPAKIDRGTVLALIEQTQYKGKL